MRATSGAPAHSRADLRISSLSSSYGLAGQSRWPSTKLASRAPVAHATSWEAHPSTCLGATASGPQHLASSPPPSRYPPSDVHVVAASEDGLPPLPHGVAEHLDSLGISPSSIDPQLRALHSFAAHAEPSLATLATLNSRQRVATLVNGHPELLCVPLEGWLSFLTAYGVTRRDFFRLLSHNPDLFTRGSLFNAGSVIAYLQSLGLSPRDVSSTIIPRCSGLLLLDLYGQLAPAVEFLRSELELDAAGLKALLCRCPRALCLDPPSQLAPRLGALAAAGFSRAEVCALVRHNTALLIGDVPGTLQSRLAFLTGHCGFNGTQALQLMSQCPEVLSLSVPNLRRKWRFLVERMNCGTQAVLAYPRYWAKSLLLDIGPRYSYVRERQLLPLAGAPCTLAAAGAGGSSSSEGYGGSSSSSSSSSGSSGSIGDGGVACGQAGACELNLQLLLDSDDIAFVETVWRAAAGGAGAGGTGSSSGSNNSSSSSTGAAAKAPARVAAAAAAAAAAAEAEAAMEMSALELAADFGDLPGNWAGTAGSHHQGLQGGGTGLGRRRAQEDEVRGRLNEFEGEKVAAEEEVAEEGDPGAAAEAVWAGPGPDDYERFRAAWLETEGVRWSGVNAVGVGGATGGVAGSW
ncbi:hypothetical protein HYH02_010925 [Chlamydomonas schloesseri]|uniref:Uncharacterized protein n=1 Tax=Chlamydomonas schloesseri TaxID=2026947 RepID=A0A835W5U1_9CHLO|nr:hypothetical protein HYH02_010925 [Chlamydomonas schloesseri]|eukprot:KAG2438224.1 hypothetical protein HYH02_010925 [Chlamydomonas schloesseri]